MTRLAQFIRNSCILLSVLLVPILAEAHDGNNYQAVYATVAPTVDGNPVDAAWATAPWYSHQDVWIGTGTPTAADCSMRFKFVWTANALYVLGEVYDDVLSAVTPGPGGAYYEYDLFEVFVDENHSGGGHTNNYNAFAYHFTTDLQAIDIDNGTPRYHSDVTITRTNPSPGLYYWEARIPIYADTYVWGAANTPVTLTQNKVMGVAVAYVDNDGGASRQHMLGSEVIPVPPYADKNQAYQTANVFGEVTLVNTYTPPPADYEATLATVAPTIDGSDADAVWASAPWYTLADIWVNNVGTPPTVTDFSGRFKLAWDADALYILAEITDQTLNGNPVPVGTYYEYDVLEVFVDEDYSGGGHQNTHNAFAYHIALDGTVVDTDVDATAKVFPEPTMARTNPSGNTYLWEVRVPIYNDTYTYGGANTPVTLAQDKQLGFLLAYIDNDGGPTRQHMIGSQPNSNTAYIDASTFGELRLVNVATPPTGTFNHFPVANGFVQPSVMTMLPDGRVLVCEQAGRVRVIENDALLATPMLDLTASISRNDAQPWNEQGLIGITPDPNFASNGYLYVTYTTNAGGLHNRVSRFTVTGNIANPASEFVVINMDGTTAHNHNGGALHFLPDGTLLISHGENAVPANAQAVNTHHGKLLRVNSDGTIPTDNPFYASGTTPQRRAQWATGLRNPFTFDVQPGTGRIFVNDVGQDSWEEINDATPAGRNFGWPSEEGSPNSPSFVNPYYAYSHAQTAGNFRDSTGCSITGGTFFNPTLTNYPAEYVGDYFFLDYCGNWINVIDPSGPTAVRSTFASTLGRDPIAIDVGPVDGKLYYLCRNNNTVNGAVYRIEYSGSALPIITDQPDTTFTFESQPTQLCVGAGGPGPFTYQWYKDGAVIGGAQSSCYDIVATVPGDAGKYTVVVSNAFGSIESDTALLTVGPFNTAPVPVIASPIDGAKYNAGDAILFSGTATDAEDGVIPPAQLRWKIDFHHNTHTHGGSANIVGTGGTLNVPLQGEKAHNVWIRIYLIAEDSQGLTDTAYVEIFPNKSYITLTTTPAGLQVTFDGQPQTDGWQDSSVVLNEFTIAPVSPQSLGGNLYAFDNWSHGGSASQDINTPASNTTYTANYTQVPLTNQVLNSLDDAYIRQNPVYPDPDQQSVTFGTTDPNFLVVKNWNQGPNRFTWIMFDLSSVNSSIFEAKLRLFGAIINEGTPPGSAAVSIYASEDTSWSENTINFNNSPAFNGSDLIATQNLDGSLVNKWYEWDVSSFITAAKANGESRVSFVITGGADLFQRLRFHSDENASGNGPELSVTSYDIITPVGMIYFEALPQGDDVSLRWATVEETNNQGFQVQRSADGVNYEPIGFVAGAGNSTQLLYYSFTDADPLEGINYYRLRQMDYNGDDWLSSVRSVLMRANSWVKVAPNPFQKQTTLRLASEVTGPLTVEISDLTGHRMGTLEYEQVNGLVTIPWAYPSGVYMLRVTSASGSQTIRVMALE